MKHLNLRQLEIFRAVMETRSITRAGERLNISQPAVSRALSALEAEIGFALFHRSRGSVQPSTDAELLASEVERLFQQTHSLRESVERVRHSYEGRLSVSSIPSLAGAFIGAAVGRLVRKRPRMGFELHSRISHQVVQDVVHHRVDIGFIHGATDDRGVHQWTVGESEVVCVMHRDHPLAERDSLEPRDLAGQPLVFLDKHAPMSHLIREAFAAAGHQPTVVVETNLSAAAKAVVSSGGAIALLDPLTLLDGSANLVMRAFRPRIPVRIYCLTSARRPLSHAAKLLSCEVTATIEAYAESDPSIQVHRNE